MKLLLVAVTNYVRFAEQIIGYKRIHAFVILYGHI